MKRRRQIRRCSVPPRHRVKGGTDLVGDSYDADPSSSTYQPVPHPDPNPLDCNGHGSHVAGTAAGSGVLANGTGYTGPYNATTVSEPTDWTIGPGVAPKADIYSIRVFGCNGSTDVTVDAIEWAVDHDMDVINMSLGSPFGSADDPSAQATTNAVKAGIVVATSAGNNGLNQYIVGSPSTADGAISVAAIDGTQSFPGASITLPDFTINNAINANGYQFSGPVTYSIKVIKNDTTTATRDESLGCSVADFTGPTLAPLPPNTIAVVNRGVCARVAKAIFGQQAGAAAVVMVNTDGTLPPFEGKITSNPDDGTPYTVTIPFLGVAGPPTGTTSDGAKLRAEADCHASDRHPEADQQSELREVRVVQLGRSALAATARSSPIFRRPASACCRRPVEQVMAERSFPAPRWPPRTSQDPPRSRAKRIRRGARRTSRQRWSIPACPPSWLAIGRARVARGWYSPASRRFRK